ncbi:MAG TPA: methyl-accepting chemotaxis protein [Bryobacteraceae bacterium]|nr:methyl-accepting chemotaxis protein [Bryobacteraceae bacterium]
MTIGKKLLAGFGTALVLTLAMSLFAFWSIGSLGATLQKVAKVEALKRYLASDISTTMSDFLAEERGIVARSFIKDTAAIEKYHQDFRDSEARFKKSVDQFLPLIETEEARRGIQELQTNQEQIAQSFEEFYRVASAGQSEAAAAMAADKVLPLIMKSKATTDQLVQHQSTVLVDAVQAAESSVSQARWIAMLMIALSLLVGMVLVFVVRQINSGLRRAVMELSEGAGQTASAAAQVSSASQSLAQGSSEQAASLEETSASSEEINAMAHKNTENATAAASVVVQSQQRFAQTNESLDQMVAAMSEINESSDKISKIIKVIDEIAFQTNILALNAAVEAARAGEAGMGFAVVADEVRNLAQRCAQAAKDTAGLIEESIGKSNEGKTKVDQVAVAIRAITEEAGKIKTLVDEVQVGSQEQARGIQEISKAIAQMEQVTQSTAANAEESASAAEELTAQSEAVRAIVQRLGAMVGGASSDDRRAGLGGGSKPAVHRSSDPGEPAYAGPSTPVAHKIQHPVGHPTPAVNKSAIPLEDDFKEF